MFNTKIVSSIVILLAVIILSGIFASGFLKENADQLDERISLLSKNVSNGNWQGAAELMEQIESDWKGNEKTWSILVDHFEIDNIGDSLYRLKEYIVTENTSMSLAEAAALVQSIRHIPEKEKPLLKNIL